MALVKRVLSIYRTRKTMKKRAGIGTAQQRGQLMRKTKPRNVSGLDAGKQKRNRAEKEQHDE
jgi:hypothetical protein